ncbi:MAG: alpha/beta hydrolase [Clostridia bacterium]|nr:alpha/beta hydrolase [Clostridia bacterium]
MFDKIIAFFISVIFTILNALGLGGVFGGINSSDAYVFANMDYGKHERQVLDLAIPKDNDGEIGLVLFIHGGAWIAGDKDGYKDAVGSCANDLGIAAAALNYRYLDESVSLHDIADDIDSALSAIKTAGEKKGVKINKVLLTGSSAGAHLSMFYAYSRKDTAPITPAAVCSYCGPTDLYDSNFYYESALGDTATVCGLMSWACGQTFTIEEKDSAKDALYSVSPIAYVNENTVPTILCHGEKDDVVPYSNALSIIEKFEQYGVEYEFISYPNSDHGLANDPDCAKRADKLLHEYAIEYLK